MKYIVVVLTFVAVAAAVPLQKKCCESYCYSRDLLKNDRVAYASKTAYQFVKGKNMNFDLPSCQATKLYMFSRHGTRLPEDEEIEDVEKAQKVQKDWIKNYKNGQKPKEGALCAEDEALLKSWEWDKNITVDKAEWLTQQGWEDLYGLAESFKPLMQQLVTGPWEYTTENFHFRHTETQRTTNSFRAFYEGLFGRGSSQGLQSPPVSEPDMLLKPYDTCEVYVDRRGWNVERKAFEEMEDFQRVLDDVSTKLGFDETLKKNRINIMWDLCRYEQAWYLNEPSPWCTAFTSSQHAILHYREDLKQFYKAGHGHEENRNLMCSAVKDMLNVLRATDGPPVTAYFGHSTGMYLFLTSLGWFEDEIPLTAANYPVQGNRRWYISNLAPFASNVAAVKYSCDDGEDWIQFFFNEHLMQFDWCDNGACRLSDVLEKYSYFLEADCDATFCQ